MTEPIPGPSGLPFLGNLFDLQHDEAPIRALEHLADVYGPIYQITIQGRKVIVCSSVELLDELFDEKRFVKYPPPSIGARSDSRPAGLFLANNEDPDWGQAHRVLLPAFGPLSIEAMFDGKLSFVSFAANFS